MSTAIDILVVEDDPDLLELLVDELESSGYAVRQAGSLQEAEAAIADGAPDLLITDLKLPDGEGVALLDTLNDADAQNTGVLVISAFGTVERAVSALKLGADDFLTKPLDLDHLLIVVERIAAHRSLRAQVAAYREVIEQGDAFHGLLGDSPAMQQLRETIRRFANLPEPVLIEGESGTGKELIARALHAESQRHGNNFVPVNCAGVPEDLLESEFFGHAAGAFTGASKAHTGLFEQADGGTLFLDEIGEMPANLQAKLLRVLEDGRIRPVGGEGERSVDTRVLAATNRDLQQAVADGRFREDLYFRLEAFHLHVPALREREEDVLLLAAHFLKQQATSLGRGNLQLSEAARSCIRDYDFPGNVRELRNAMKRAAVFANGSSVARKHLPERMQASANGGDSADGHQLALGTELPTLEAVRARYVTHVLDAVDGNKQQAARVLGVGRRSLYRWLDEDG